MQYNIGDYISEGLYKGYKVINTEQISKYDMYVLEDPNKEIHKVVAGYIDLGLNNNDSDLLISLDNLSYKKLVAICFQNPQTKTFREDKSYVYVDLTKRGLKKGDLVMAYSPGKTTISDISDRQKLINCMHKTKCKVVKTYNISKKETIKDFLSQNKKFIIGINEHIDLDGNYIIDSIDYALDHIDGRLPSIKGGINPETGELKLWELARNRKQKLSKSESIQASENRLNSKNKFNALGALCYSLLEQGNQPYQIHAYLLKQNLIPKKDKEYSRDQLNKYFYYSSLYYCDNAAAYKSLMSSLYNVTSNNIRLVDIQFLTKLKNITGNAIAYMEKYNDEKVIVLNKRSEYIEQLKNIFDRNLTKQIYNELDNLDEQLANLDKKYSDNVIAQKIIDNKTELDNLLYKLL